MYQALYRKWRPLTFDDVVSQPHITVTLRNQIKNNKTAHAYLFTGSRGTGKTTCARIFAKTVNCLSPCDGTPCLECAVCKQADAGTLVDIIEIDAASNTGVDDIRELRESAAFMPEQCRFKLYIIDEVHMLSVNAFNALLKIMEEPPDHVKFILATTEIHKVPATIISRCQRFDFRRIQSADLVARLFYITAQEGISITPDAAELIAKLSDGGMRDALSLLDQCLAFAQEVTLQTVSDAAGIAGREYLFELVRCALEQDAPAAIALTDRLYAQSKDITRLCEELLSQFRNLMLLKAAPANESVLDCLSEERAQLISLAQTTDLDTILSKLTILRGCLERLPRASSKRLEAEMCMVRLCTPESRTVAGQAASDGLEERLTKLERALAAGVPAREPSRRAPNAEPAPQSPPPEVLTPKSVLKIADFSPLDNWAALIDRLYQTNPAVAGFLHDSSAMVHGDVLLLAVRNDFFLKMIKLPENAQALAAALKDVYGKSFRLRIKSANLPDAPAEDPFTQLIDQAKNAGIDTQVR
ncbi:MAG: DNA polymerase III subunit gamma/tau [Oscillospiraceae bacterium]